jgi:replicative DNA helicase
VTSTDRHLEAVPPGTPPSGPGDFDRTPPHDDGAERIVLGAMMLSADAVADVTDQLTADDFYQPRHAELYRRILAAYSRGEPCDPQALAAGMVTDTTLMRLFQNGVYLFTLIESVPTAAHATWHARVIAERAQRRRLLEAATRIQQMAYTDELSSPTQLADRASSALYAATDEHLTSDLMSVGDLVDSTIAAVEEAGRNTGLRGLSTGLTDLDRLLNGLHNGQLIIVAGRPAMGKSIEVTDIARHVALRHRLPVALFNLEMSRDELMLRIVSAEARIAHRDLVAGRLDDTAWATMAKTLGDIADAPLYIDDTADMGLSDIRAKARRLAQRAGIRLLIVDYLQLLRPADSGGRRRPDSREREVAEMSRGLKVLAKELDIPVIAVAQLNRGPEQRTDKTPYLSDLRESGSLENDADVVILVHRPDYYDNESPRAGEVDLIVAKNRSGPSDTITACAQMHLQRFVDMAV